MNDNQEIWKDVPGWEGIYNVSNFGRVRSESRIINEKRVKDWLPKKYTVKEKILKPSIQLSGHLRVSLSRNSRITFKMIHQLVLSAFIGAVPDGKECCHKDGNPKNNHINNLYYGTRSQNIKDAKNHGTFPMGSNRPGAKLTEEQARNIYELCKQGETDEEISNKFNVSKGCVVQIRLGFNWKEQTGAQKICKSLRLKNRLTEQQILFIKNSKLSITKLSQILKVDRHALGKFIKTYIK